jgi:hypothetical protein
LNPEINPSSVLERNNQSRRQRTCSLPPVSSQRRARKVSTLTAVRRPALSGDWRHPAVRHSAGQGPLVASGHFPFARPPEILRAPSAPAASESRYGLAADIASRQHQEPTDPYRELRATALVTEARPVRRILTPIGGARRRIVPLPWLLRPPARAQSSPSPAARSRPFALA